MKVGMKSCYGAGAAVMLPTALGVTSAVVLTAGHETSGRETPITHQSLGSYRNPENSKTKLKSQPKFSVKIGLIKNNPTTHILQI